MELSTTHPVGPLPWKDIIDLGGLEILRRMMDGRLPLPHFGPTMSIWPRDIEEGKVVFEGRPSLAYTNPQGTMHGGWLATLLDSATGMAVQSTLHSGKIFTTTSLTTNFVRAVGPNDEIVTCSAEATYSGGRMASAEAHIRGADGKLIAHGVAGFFIASFPKSTPT